MATALGRFRGRETDDVVLVLLAGNLLHAAQQIVGVDDDETARTSRQQVQGILIGVNAARDHGDNAPRVAQGIVAVVQRGVHYRGPSPSGSASAAGRTAGRSGSVAAAPAQAAGGSGACPGRTRPAPTSSAGARSCARSRSSS